MACIRRIALSGAQCEVTGLSGSNVCIRNDGADMLFASIVKDFDPSADRDVLPIPIGDSAVLPGCSGTVYLHGTGEAVLIATDYPENFFKPSAGGSAGGTDSVARAAISAINAPDTGILAQAKLYTDSCRFGANMLNNPDFSIDQRGLGSYSSAGFCADRWCIPDATEAQLTDSGIRVLRTADSGSKYSYIQQTLERPSLIAGRTLTLSCRISETTAANAAIYLVVTLADGSDRYLGTGTLGAGDNCVTVDVPTGITAARVMLIAADPRLGDSAGMYTVFAWAKLEYGDAATDFIPPLPACELLECQRFYQLRSTDDVAQADLRPVMYSAPVVTQVAGGFAYAADL